MDSSLISLGIGLTAGFLYGCSFALQQRSTFVLKDGRVPPRHPIGCMLHGTLRIMILAGCLITLLRSPQINPILFLASFGVMFWLVVTRSKACRRA